MSDKVKVYIILGVLIVGLFLASFVAISAVNENAKKPNITTYDVQQYFVDLNGDGLEDLIVEGKVIINNNPIVAESFPKSQ